MNVLVSDKLTTGNTALDTEQPFLTSGDMEKLADCAKFLQL